MKRNKLQALINLVDDPDLRVFNIVEKELLTANCDVIVALEEKWESSYDEKCQERIENLIQNLQFKQTKDVLKKWLKLTEPDLFEGFLIVDRFQFPDQNIVAMRAKVEKLRKSVWIELNDSLTLLEKTAILNHVFFNIYGFSLNYTNIYSPQNCFLNQLQDTRKGNPVSISIYYTIVARMLGFPAYFVDFPKNPLIALVEPRLARRVYGKENDSDVVFYINPSNKGSVTGRKEIDYHLKKHNLSISKINSEPRSNKDFIKKLFEYLLESYRSLGFKEKEERVAQLLQLF
jgi:hypothetical protein